MRWEQLFDDLETQLEHELGAEAVDLRAEEERLRLGRLTLRDRLLALLAPGSTGVIRLVLSGGEQLIVQPSAFGKDWLSGELITQSHRRSQCVVPLWAVGSVIFSQHEVETSLAEAPENGPRVIDRIGFAFVLRDLCRRRAGIDVTTTGGVQHGTIDRVGRDHFDLAVHEQSQPRRAALVHELRIVPFEQVQLIRI